VGQDIIVSGIMSPLAANGLYSPTGATGSLGKPKYQKAGSPSFTIASDYYGAQSPAPSVWTLVESAGSIGLGSVGINTTLFVSVDNTTNTTPVDAAFWIRQDTSKDITVASPVGSYLGQLYNKLFSGLWYRWNGTGWDADKILTAGTGINITDSVISATGFTDYHDLNNLPTLGTAAATDITNYVTITGNQDGTVGKPAISGIKKFDDHVYFQAGAAFNSFTLFDAEAGFNDNVTFNLAPVLRNGIEFDNDFNGGEFEVDQSITLRADTYEQYQSGVPNAVIYLPVTSGTLALTSDIVVTGVSGTTNRVNVAISEYGNALITLPNVVSGLTSVSAKSFIEGVYSVGQIVGTVVLTAVAESVITATLTSGGPATFTLPTPAAGKSIIFHLKQAATPTTASFTDVIWSGGVAPVITAIAGKVDILSFAAGPNAAGTGYKWYGSIIQNFSPT
jgi:hypothetical protein